MFAGELMIEIKTIPTATFASSAPTKIPSTVIEKRKAATVRESKPVDYVTNDEGISLKIVPFILMHVACLAVFLVGISLPAVLLCIALYMIRMFALTAGYHRYFAHRAFKTSRFFQFVLAVVGTTAVQKGPLWWASHHRKHHKYTDQEGDLHSPVTDGFWWSHIGWVISRKYDPTDWPAIKDFARYPELRWINKYHLIPAITLAVLCFLLGGWLWLVWGFFVSTVALYHGTFSVNSLAHMWGSRRYATGDDSRNNFLIALWTGGEGWHNNHHHYMASVKQGFYWWEIDFSYYALKMMSWVRLVWDLRLPPQQLVAGAN
jgi:stearoyl-CoA desaturase (delta-9 desaturase)